MIGGVQISCKKYKSRYQSFHREGCPIGYVVIWMRIRKNFCCCVGLPDQVWQPRTSRWNFWMAWGKSVSSVGLEFLIFTNVGIFVFIHCYKMSQGALLPCQMSEKFSKSHWFSLFLLGFKVASPFPGSGWISSAFSTFPQNTTCPLSHPQPEP